MGICVGMQMLATTGHEYEEVRGSAGSRAISAGSPRRG